MSKVGKTPIVLPSGVTVTVSGNTVTVTGPKGNLSYALPEGIKAVVESEKVVVSQEAALQDTTGPLFGLARAYIANMVKGVSVGFEKRLELVGVGYRAQAGGTDVTLSVGFSHPVKMKAPAGITFAMADNQIIVSGSDKALVGNTAAIIRAVRPPEPYKGKGIKYVDEYIRRKAGKAAKAVGGAPGAK